jgi:hypothetical protein
MVIFRQLHRIDVKSRKEWLILTVFFQELFPLSLQERDAKCLYICVFISVAYIFFEMKSVYDDLFVFIFYFWSILGIIQTFWEASLLEP